VTTFAWKWRWVCPRCGAEMKAGDQEVPGDAPPPTCGFGHTPCEMEQRTIPRDEAAAEEAA
jgi:hypothetical protein